MDTESLNLDEDGDPLTFRTTMAGPNGEQWTLELCKEYRRLHDSGTIRWNGFITKPDNRKATYFSLQVREKIGPNGEIKRRVRGTVGGNRVEFTGDRSSTTASLETLKILLNAVLSEDGYFCTCDIEDFYLGTPMERHEYMYIDARDIPEEIKNQYDIQIINGRAMVSIQKGMYGLPYAGKIAQDKLFGHLTDAGFVQCLHTNCLFYHPDRPKLFFMTIVDDFGIKFIKPEDRDFLFDTLTSAGYKIKIDFSGKKFIGLTINHDRINQTITLNMPGYVANALKRFGVKKNAESTNSPLIHHPIVYGQQMELVDESPKVTDSQALKRIQQIVGVFLYYARAVDETMLCAVNKIASRQSEPTEDLVKDVDRFLQYAATWPNAEIVYHKSAMRLFVHSDASYCSELGSRSRCGGFSWLGTDLHGHNGGIGSLSKIMPNVFSSAAEAEYGGFFINGQQACIYQNILRDLGYPQQKTPMVGDNSTATSASHKTIRIRRLQSVAMRYHWIQDRVKDGQFDTIWQSGRDNKADFFTKIHPASHHRAMRGLYVHDPPLNHYSEKESRKKNKTSC
jgi:hypothetical protein